MSWNGTVRCGHCFAKGHNRRSCPQVKRLIAARPDSYLAQDERYKKEQAKKRRCGWCSETGHNQTTCRHKKDGQTRLNELASHVETQLSHILSIAGFGRGAVLKKLGRNDSREATYGTVLSGYYKDRSQLNDDGDDIIGCPVRRATEPVLSVLWSDGTKDLYHLPNFKDALQGLLHGAVGSAGAWSYWGFSDVSLVAQSNEPLKVETKLILQQGQNIDSIDAWIAAVKENVKKCEDYKKRL